MVECTKDFVRECVKDHVAENEIEAFLNEAAQQLKSEDFYCNDGLFSAPVLKDEKKKEIPCNETFYNESRDCGDTFQTKFRSNRADETLCKYVPITFFLMIKAGNIGVNYVCTQTLAALGLNSAQVNI